MSASLNLQLSGHKGQYIGFFHSGGNPIVRGYWERKNGSEGGELHVDTKSSEVIDYDGCFELPNYVVNELKTLSIKLED